MSHTTELTAIEREVLLDASLGLSNIQIGFKQFRSPETIRTHMKNIFAKLNARNRAHAVAIAYDTGIFRCRTPHLPQTQAIPPMSLTPTGRPCRSGYSDRQPICRLQAHATRTTMTDPSPPIDARTYLDDPGLAFAIDSGDIDQVLVRDPADAALIMRGAAVLSAAGAGTAAECVATSMTSLYG